MITAEAQTDSLTAAFFLLKFDRDLLFYKAQADSSLYEARISDIRAGYSRQMWTVLASTIMTLMLVWVATQYE